MKRRRLSLLTTYINDVVKITGTTINPQLDWNNKVYVWDGLVDGTIQLPSTATLPIPAGWQFGFYNESRTAAVTIVNDPADTISSHNDQLIIAGQSEARIGKFVEGTPNQYWASIEQVTYKGAGAVALDSITARTDVIANTWTEVVFPVYQLSGTLLNIGDDGTGRLRIDYPLHGTRGVYATIHMHASMDIPDANSVRDMTFGVNGVVDAVRGNLFRASAQSAATSTANQFWPYGLSWEGFLNNGDVISMFVRYTQTAPLFTSVASFQIATEAIIGVDLTP